MASGSVKDGRVARRHQRGAALMLILVMVSLLVAMFAGIFVNDLVRQNQRQERTTNALAQAKQAMIGRAASDDNRPGSLPCPDTDDDGSAELFSGNDCPSYIGRLPWKSLGLPDLRDSDGERLWYALSNNYRDHGTAEPINSDTKGNRTVHSENTAVTLTTEAVAVIFAPGAPLGTQDRHPSTTALCPTTGTTIARQRCAANYLDTTGGANNATTAGAYVSAQHSNSFNDRLLLITTAELMPVVEQRVAREMLKVLQSYKANSGCNCYPWPDLSTGFSDFGLNRGRIPGYDLAGTTVPPYALPVDWGVSGAPTLPQWFIDNGWRRIIYYAVGRNFLESSGAGCTSCESGETTLRVNNVPGTEVVILTPGAAGAGRPVAYPWTGWSPYIEDPENNDNSDDHYEIPSSSGYSRDRLYTIP